MSQELPLIVIEMSHFEYNLKGISQEEQQNRYDIIYTFLQLDPYFAYLPYINSPTNNYLKYSNQDLNNILTSISYGVIQSEEYSQLKKLYIQFAKDYQHYMEIYIREQQEKIRHQQEALLKYTFDRREYGIQQEYYRQNEYLQGRNIREQRCPIQQRELRRLKDGRQQQNTNLQRQFFHIMGDLYRGRRRRRAELQPTNRTIEQPQKPRLSQRQTQLYRKYLDSQSQGFIEASDQSQYNELVLLIRKFNISIQVKLAEPEHVKIEKAIDLSLNMPQNLSKMEENLEKYLFDDIDVCRMLIQKIIKQALNQPTYASNYAQLCKNFCKHESSKFNFQNSKKENPFKQMLIESIQHSFVQKSNQLPNLALAQNRNFLKDKQKHIFSRAKFVAELIIHKAVRKETVRLFLSQLFYSIFQQCYYFIYRRRIEVKIIYEYYFQAIIEFIENIGSLHDYACKKGKMREIGVHFEFENVRDHMYNILTGTSTPQYQIFHTIKSFNGDEYFQILDLVNDSLIQQKFPRFNYMIQNLKQRRGNFKQFKKSQKASEHNQSKKLNKKEEHKVQKAEISVKELFEEWQIGKNELKEIKSRVEQMGLRNFYFSFLKQVSDGTKDQIIKRTALFQLLLPQILSQKQFKDAWFDIIKYLAIRSGKYPYCEATLALIIHIFLQTVGGNINDFYRKYDGDKEEDEKFFLQEILKKYYHYSNDVSVLEFIRPKIKFLNLI